MDIQPFRGWRYCPPSRDVSSFIAPPYDVLSEEDRDALLAANPKNIVAVDLPHFPPSERGQQQEYQHAAWVLGEWKGEGTLIQEPRPALYAYEQEFRWAGQIYHRRSLLCGIRAAELGKDIIPHEHTFEGPKADRLELTRHTKTQLSPIFGFYSDAEEAVVEHVWANCRRPADLWGELNGVQERLWIMDDPSAIRSVQAALKEVPLFIADGHHRCTTAMNYRDQLAAAGVIGPDHEANFILFALVPRDDPGLLVLPTHRIIRGLRDDFSVARLAKTVEAFEWKRCSVDEADLHDTDTFLRRYGRGAMAFFDHQMAEAWIARLKDPEAMVRAAPDETDAWRKLDVAVLHKLIIDQALAPWREDVFIEYTPHARAVLAACQSGRAQLGVCLQGTPLEAVERIALAGASMPHKSTYFYPKIATGIVLKPLE